MQSSLSSGRHCLAAVLAYPLCVVCVVFPQDVFSIAGRGTVATGRVESGVVNTTDQVEVQAPPSMRAGTTVAHTHTHTHTYLMASAMPLRLWA